MVLIQQSVKQFNAFEWLIHALDYNMSEILVLISKQAQNLLDWHPQWLCQ